jgi:ribosomal protein S18 acetylase RimI-like enzyme
MKDLPKIYSLLDVSFDHSCGYVRKRGVVRKFRFYLPTVSYFLETFFIQDTLFSSVKKIQDIPDYLPKYLVAESDQKILGTCGIVNERNIGVWRFFVLAVLPEFRQQGIAKKLLETAILHLRKKGALKVRLGVEQNNLRALKLYKKVGFIQEKLTSRRGKQFLTMSIYLKPEKLSNDAFPKAS